nr:hypothetical protein [Streptomyces sp. SP2-10]
MGGARWKSPDALKLGRLWAVEGWPATPDDDQPRPLDCWSALGRPRSRQVHPGRRHFLRNKKSEWEEYRSEVTAFELRKNLPVL